MDAAQLRRLIEEQERTGKPMVGSAYAETVGIPALFASSCRARLLSLGDDEGAKALFLSQPDAFATVSFAQGAVDIDTAADYERLTKTGLEARAT